MNIYNRIFIGTFGGAIVILLWWHYGGKATRQQILPFFPFLLGLSMFSMAAGAVKTGEVTGGWSSVYRDRNPVNFWGIVILSIAGGIILVAASIWKLANN